MEMHKGREKEYVHCNSEHYTRIRAYSDRWIQIRKCDRRTGEDVFMYFSIDEMAFIERTMSTFLKEVPDSKNRY
ncbi:hypothetical protein [Methanolobus profundi]|uniref:Uncharacterized protein n=1 Tax=Methanolobus profundi TaxID=487685 RepID=A0A1I4S7R3_9EURY|nr:hypothetical protein [Methanolobus profundi]SFM60324.1 hypothetical protein SAMN04488696_1814 [Methanolobus profundi]